MLKIFQQQGVASSITRLFNELVHFFDSLEKDGGIFSIRAYLDIYLKYFFRFRIFVQADL